jgi:Holliday junction resolvase
MLESTIVSSFLGRVRRLADKGIKIRAIKVHGGGFTSGQPDVLVCFEGHMIQIEFKQPGKVPTDRQREELLKWAKAGATTMVATDAITPLINLGLLNQRSETNEKSSALEIPDGFDA